MDEFKIAQPATKHVLACVWVVHRWPIFMHSYFCDWNTYPLLNVRIG